MKELTLMDGKYTFRLNEETEELVCLRYGQPWREFVGDNAVHALFHYACDKIVELEEQVEVGLQVSGSFFSALKPLSLSAINVSNPGQHVADLIAENTAKDQRIVELTANWLRANDTRAEEAHRANLLEADSAAKDQRIAELEHGIQRFLNHA